MEPIKKVVTPNPIKAGEEPKLEKLVEEKVDGTRIVAAPVQAESETITIKKDTLDELMARLERVEKAADKSRLAKYDEANKGKNGKIVKLRTIRGKVVISWSDMLTNTVEKDSNMRWKEDQTIEIFYEDKTSEKMELIFFNRHMDYLIADVISETKEGNNIILKVKTEDGREYEINNKFIN